MVVRKQLLFPIALFFVLSGVVYHAFTDPQNSGGFQTDPTQVFQQFQSDPSLRNASWSIFAKNLSSGETLLSHNPDLALTPASVQKLVTTITALKVLGPDYRFETFFETDGAVENGVLKGNLIIRGTGDPTFGSQAAHDSLSISSMMNKILLNLGNLGIKKISGDIIADGSAFDNHLIPRGWIWEDMGNYYGAGAHALTINENLYSIFFNPALKEGEKASVSHVVPQIPEIEFINDVTTGSARSGDNVYIFGSPRQNQRWLTGTVPLGQNNFKVKGSVPDPGKLYAFTVYDYLNKNEIQVDGTWKTDIGSEIRIDNNRRKLLFTTYSPTLATIATRTNHESVNTYAENILKHMALKAQGKGTYEAGCDFILNYWKQRGIDAGGWQMEDGSGLSPENTLTTRQLVFIISDITSENQLFNALKPGLPIAGKSGSLRDMFKGTPSEGVLQAKSGFLGSVRSYAGFTQNAKGEMIVFAFIINNYNGTPASIRRKMETVMNSLTTSP